MSVDVQLSAHSVGHMSDMALWASEVARVLLEHPLPRRWNHSKGVAERARSLAPILGEDAGLLETAAWLHDIGYSPELEATGFHPLDGARYLRDVQHADERLCRLVGNHSCAILEAEQRGLAEALADEFPPVDQALRDALTYCDMTTTPDGSPVTVGHRLSEIRERYGPGHLVTHFIGRAEPHLVGAVRNVQDRLFLAESAV